MRSILLILVSIVYFNNAVFCQESKTSFEIFLLSDFTFQSFDENDITNSYPIVEKGTLNGLNSSYGFGTQIEYKLHTNFSVQFGLGLKLTSMDLWLDRLESSDSKWHYFAKEEAMLLHLFGPMSIYYQSIGKKKFKVKSGISIEPNLLIHSKSSFPIWDSDLLLEISEPKSSPRSFFGVMSVNLKCSYEFENLSGIYTELKIHNAQRYFNEEQNSKSLPIGFMINLGYKFKPLQR